MQLTTVMVVALIGWCSYTLLVRGGHMPPLPIPRNIVLSKHALGWLYGSKIPQMFGAVAVFIALGHSVLAMSGAESLAQVYREIEHPKLPNLKKAAAVIFVYSLVFTSLVSFFAVMIIPDRIRPEYFENLIGGLADELAGTVRGAAGVSRVRGGGGDTDPFGRGKYGHRGIERRAEPRVGRRSAFGLVSRAAHAIRNVVPDHQYGGRAADRDDSDQPRRCDVSGEPVRVRRDLEFRAERHGGAGAAIHAAAGTRVSKCR